MASDIILPKLGMDMQTGTIMTWYKKEGDAVTKGEPLFELMTDKVNLEVEAESSGTLLKRYYEVGTELPVFAVIGCIGQLDEAIPTQEKTEAIPNSQASGQLSEEDRAVLRAIRGSNREGFSAVSKSVRATPAARRLATNNQINLASIQGSGANGRIQEEDVNAYLSSKIPEEKMPKNQKEELGNTDITTSTDLEKPSMATPSLGYEENPGMKDSLDMSLEELVIGMGDLEEELHTQPESKNVLESAVVTEPSGTLDKKSESVITVSPLAEKIAIAEKIDIKNIGEGSGPDGRIMKEDVLDFIKTRQEKPKQETSVCQEIAPKVPGISLEEIPPENQSLIPKTLVQQEIEQVAVPAALESARVKEETPPEVAVHKNDAKQPEIEKKSNEETKREDKGTLEAFTPKRRIIADRMVKSNLENAVITLTTEIDMTEVKELRKKISKKVEGETGYRCTYTDFLLVSVSRALLEYPYINSSLCDEGILLHDFVNLGLAVGLEDGLVVPVIQNTEDLTFSEMVQKRSEVLKKLKSKKLTADHFQGSTFTVTNLGMYGILEFSAIINQPNSAILSVGEVVERIRVYKGEAVPRSIMKVSLNLDHRVADGMVGAKFLQTIKSAMENPALLLF